MSSPSDDTKAHFHQNSTHPEHSPDSFAATPSIAAFHYGAPSEREEAVRDFAGAAEAATPVAVLVCHGMGEQVRFETIGQLASSILSAAEAGGCRVHPNGVHLSREGDGLLARAELKWATAEGVEKEAHIYEAYWAPVTESKVTYADTLRFLFQAAWRGIRCSKLLRRSSFKRWMFGNLRPVVISAGTQLALVIVGLFLLAEVGVIAFVTLKVAAGVKELASTQWPVLPQLNGVWGTICSVASFLWHCLLQLAKPFIPQHARLHRMPLDHEWWCAAWHTLVWLATIAQAFVVRYFLIQYAGDVAAYISPFKASKFDAIRTEIQQIGLKVGRVIYGFDPVSGVPHYERVVVVGHSLGSVLAYDTLNALINTDLTSPNEEQRDVAARTTHLITFGSPLDKTAFLFRNQSNHVKDPLREQMAAGFQPLILDYKTFRSRLEWINLWSPMDIVSGSLDYYDWKDAPGYTPVVNRVDRAAWVPLVAHVQYWNGGELAKTLLGAI
ncbi:MAG TPA: hypothetical protein VN612_10695 [Acidobacteriaceae bacterium]|nr:hypothetical protein [Acidobacteriaceae bacterium]